MGKTEHYKYEPHHFSWKVNHWNVCTGCGLVALKTKITEWCIEKGCNYKDHPSYKYRLKKLTKQEWSDE